MFEVFEQMTHQYNRTSYEQLKEFIYREQEKMFDRADKRREQLQMPELLSRYCSEMREVFLKAIGGKVKTDIPLEPRITNRLNMGEYTIEAVVFQSRPQTYVTGSLYIPKGISLPGPAVLFVCGHSPEGRMDDDYQRVCYTLVKAGLIVFAMDPLGQGERSNFYDPESKTYPIKRTTPDHDACGIPAVAAGCYLQRYFLCDEMRAVDYMLTRPEIDPSRIGVTGNSGGGTQTIALMTCDDRIAAAAPGTFVTSRRAYMYQGQPQDSEQIWQGIAEKGFDHAEPFLIFAPRPAAVLAVTCDFFPIEGTLETFHTAQRIYEMLGKKENIRLYEDNDTHSYTARLAVCAAEFFSEVFLGKKVTVDNSFFEPLSPKEMYALKTGNLTDSIRDSSSTIEEIRKYAVALREKRLSLPEEERRKRAKKWLSGKVMKNRQATELIPRIFPRSACTQMDGYMGTSISFWSQKRLFAYGVLIKPEVWEWESRFGIPTVLAIWEDGTKAIASHELWIRAQCEAGRQIFVLDVPGVGAIEQRNMILNASYKGSFGTLYTLACNLMYMGDSLAAMRCYDVLRAIEMLNSELGVPENDITLYCEGPDGVYGIMAAFLNENVQVQYGEGLLESVEREYFGEKLFRYDNTLTLLVPGMLEYFDYGELKR